MPANQDRHAQEEQKEQAVDSLYRKVNVEKTKVKDVSKELEESDLLRYDWQSAPFIMPSAIQYDSGELGSGICPLWVRENCTIESIALMHNGSGTVQHSTTTYFTFTAWSRNNQAAFSPAHPTHAKQLVGSGIWEIPPPYQFDAQLEKNDTIFLVMDVVGVPSNPMSHGHYQLEVIATRRRTDG